MSAGATSSGPSSAAAAWPLPRWIAHRGAGRLAPENTLAAFRLGASLGWRAFECDVKLSADGVPYLLHDAALDRTTNAKGPATGWRWADLARLDAGSWHSRTYAGEPLCSLAAAAAFCRANGFALNLEIKPLPGQAADTGAAVAEHAARLWHGAPCLPLLSSFEPMALAFARDAAPALPLALLIDQLREGWFEQALSLGAAAVVAHYSLLDATMVARLHAAGLRALAYTVNDPAPAAGLLSIGADGLITDAVDRFSPAG